MSRTMYTHCSTIKLFRLLPPKYGYGCRAVESYAKAFSSIPETGGFVRTHQTH